VIPSYLHRMFGVGLVLAGAYFLAEHIYHYGFELYDIIGHEYLGLLLILVGIAINLRVHRPAEKDPEP
jgi:hypothetical protein